MKTHLDLGNEALYTSWQTKVYDRLVDSIIKGIWKDDIFEPVHVFPLLGGGFDLPPNGHHRAVAHYIVGAPLPVTIDDESFFFSDQSWPISELVMETMTKKHFDQIKHQNHLYR